MITTRCVSKEKVMLSCFEERFNLKKGFFYTVFCLLSVLILLHGVQEGWAQSNQAKSTITPTSSSPKASGVAPKSPQPAVAPAPAVSAAIPTPTSNVPSANERRLAEAIAKLYTKMSELEKSNQALMKRQQQFEQQINQLNLQQTSLKTKSESLQNLLNNHSEVLRAAQQRLQFLDSSGPKIGN